MKDLSRRPTKEELNDSLRVSATVEPEGFIYVEPADFLEALHRKGIVPQKTLDNPGPFWRVYRRYVTSKEAKDFFNSKEWLDPIAIKKLENLGLSDSEARGVLDET